MDPNLITPQQAIASLASQCLCQDFICCGRLIICLQISPLRSSLPRCGADASITYILELFYMAAFCHPPDYHCLLFEHSLDPCVMHIWNMCLRWLL